MTVKRYFAAVAVATIAVFSMNAQAQAQSDDKPFFLDRGAEEVMEYRKSVNDASVLDIEDRYADVAVVYLGNEVGAGAVKAVVQDKADQGISIGPVVGGEYFGDNFSVYAGLAGWYRFRKIGLGLEAAFTQGKPDELSDDQKKYPEFNAVGEMTYQLYRSKDLTTSFHIGLNGAFKAGKNSVYIEGENGAFIWDKTTSFNVGGGVSLAWIYSPKWSAVSHVFQIRAGLNHKLHSKKDFYENGDIGFKGQKAYFQVCATYKIMFGLGKRHTKQYNVSLLNQGYTKEQIKSMVGLK